MLITAAANTARSHIPADVWSWLRNFTCNCCSQETASVCVGDILEFCIYSASVRCLNIFIPLIHWQILSQCPHPQRPLVLFMAVFRKFQKCHISVTLHWAPRKCFAGCVLSDLIFKLNTSDASWNIIALIKFSKMFIYRCYSTVF